MIAHVFIDAENVKPDFGFMAVEKYRREYEINRVDIIGKEDVVSQKYKTAGGLYRVQNCYFGKNSADTWLCVEIAKSVFEEVDVETIIIVSSDRDFLPAIKLAVEKNKKVIVISNGFGHKNLRRLLRELKIDLSKVELVDYRDGLTAVEKNNPKKKKKSLSALMKDATPTFIDLHSQKLQKFYSHLTVANEKFFRKREDKIKFIFVKRDESLFEILFVDGMNFVVFANVLRDLGITGKKDNIEKIIDDSLLKLDGRKVYLSEDEIIFKESEDDSPFDGLSQNILQYFMNNNTKVRIIFVKCNEELFEIPFVEGMAQEIFRQVLFEKKIATAENFSDKIKESFLKVEDGKVYFLSEEEIFFSESSEMLTTIFLVYGDEFIEVPFKNGMEFKIFLETMRDYGVVGDDRFIRQVLKDSLLEVRDGRVYLVSEDNSIQENDVEFDPENLSIDSLNFLSVNNANINFVQILHESIWYNVPFVNGMSFSLFAQIIEELGISARGSSRAVISGNGFKIIHGMVYL